jgi:hypothetical protein
MIIGADQAIEYPMNDGGTMDQQHDEKTKQSRSPQWKHYKSGVLYGLAGPVLCIVAFIFAGLPLSPNQDTFNRSSEFVRLIIIMFGVPFTLCTVCVFILGDRYRKTYPKSNGPSNLMTVALTSTAIVCVLSVLAKTVLIFGFWGIIIFGFQLGFFSGIFSHQAFDAAIKLKN